MPGDFPAQTPQTGEILAFQQLFQLIKRGQNQGFKFVALDVRNETPIADRGDHGLFQHLRPAGSIDNARVLF